MRTWTAAFALLAGGPLLAATPVEYRFAPVADTTIFADTSGFDARWDSVSDGQGESLWVSTTAGGVVRRALLRFDLGAIPQGMRVVSASLSLFESRARDAHAVSMHRLLAPWGEGASDGGAQGEGGAAQAGDATWRWRDYQVAEWTTRGGDFTATASATALVGLANETYTWDSTPALVSDVSGWLADPGTNHGWILIGSELDSQTAKRFNSGDSPFSTQLPMLTVQVSAVPEPSMALMLAAGGAALVVCARRRCRDVAAGEGGSAAAPSV